jgi:hypothetical protein
VQLQKQYPDSVHAISLNVGFDGKQETPSLEFQKKVAAKLSQLGITCDNILSNESIVESFGHLGISSIPATIVFDAGGERHKTFEGNVDYETQVFPLVKELLAKPGE